MWREKIKPGNNFSFLEVNEDVADANVSATKFRLKRSHKYYYQVTAEMMLARRSTCYFVVYTLAPDMFIEKIKLDEEFFTSEMLPKLKKFFEEHYLPLAASHLMK